MKGLKFSALIFAEIIFTNLALIFKKKFYKVFLRMGIFKSKLYKILQDFHSQKYIPQSLTESSQVFDIKPDKRKLIRSQMEYILSVLQ